MTGDDCSDKRNSQNRAAIAQKAGQKKTKQQQQLENEGHANVQPYQWKHVHAFLFLPHEGVHYTHPPAQMAVDTHIPSISCTIFSQVISKHPWCIYVLTQTCTYIDYHTKHTQAHPQVKATKCTHKHLGRQWEITAISPPKTHQHTNSYSCAETQEHTSLKGTSIHKNTAHTNSTKLEMKEDDPLSSCCSYRLRWRPGRGCDRHRELLYFCILPGTSNMSHVKVLFHHRDNPQWKFCPSHQRMVVLQIQPVNISHCVFLSLNGNKKPPLILAFFTIRENSSEPISSSPFQIWQVHMSSREGGQACFCL